MQSRSGPDVLEGRAELLRFLAEIGQAARDELLLGLQARSDIRAAIIAQCYRTEGASDLGELLEKLERDETARAEVVQALREFIERPLG
jgi:hypothetical protein